MSQTLKPARYPPPLVEIACGFVFEPLARWSPLWAGVYWSERQQDYPLTQTHPATTDEPVKLSFGPSPLRAWLLSADEALVLQLQSDRMYLNWRARGEAQPRVTDQVNAPGLKGKALDEWERLRAFCKDKLGEEVKLTGVDLIKVNSLRQGVHWDTFEDLAHAVPTCAAVLGMRDVETEGFAFAANQLLPSGDRLNTQGRLMREATAAGQTQGDLVFAIEHHLRSATIEADMDKHIASMNDAVNNAFRAFCLLNLARST